MSQSQKTDILLAIFIASIVSANLLGSKIALIFGISVSVGIFAYPLTFLVTDIIAEVHGKKRSHQFLIAGVITQLLVLGLVLISIALPPSPRFELNVEYGKIFGNSARIIIASLVAFVISQSHDIWSFHKIKEKTNSKYLWLRNNLSTVVSQFIDTTIFMFIAFYHITPKFTVAFIFSLIIPYWLFKLAMAILDTPIVYAGVSWLKKSKE